MNSMIPWLSTLIFLPLIGALLILSVRLPEHQAAINTRRVALIGSTVSLFMSLYLLVAFALTHLTPSFAESIQIWRGFYYSLRADSISLLFVTLTNFMIFLVVLSSWHNVQAFVREYLALMFCLQSFLIGAFTAADLLLFFIFFEALLIPMFYLILVWGGSQATGAAQKFFLYTFLGSLPFLGGIIYIYLRTQTFNMQILESYIFSEKEQIYLWCAFFTAFAVKLPSWPFHTWLSAAHPEAPTGGSVMLAALLLKLGGYGFFRFCLPYFPSANLFFQPLIFALSLISILYGGLVAFSQTDIKKLVAYSSISHMGFVTLGLFSGTSLSIQGAIFQMLGHGIVSCGLFLMVGVIYERFHTRDIQAFGGLASLMPRYAFWSMIFIFGAVGLPGTVGFIGEILTILGTFPVAPIVAAVASFGTVISVLYGLRLYRSIFFDTLPAEKPRASILSWRETFSMALLGTLVLFFGVYPRPLLQLITPAVQKNIALITGKNPRDSLDSKGNMQLHNGLSDMPSIPLGKKYP